MCRVILGEFCSKWVKASSIQFCWVHRAFGSVLNFVSNSIDFKKFLLFFDLRSSQSFFPRLSFMCGLLAEGEWWCVQTHKHTHKYMHTYTSYLLIKGFKLTGEKARLRWKYQFLKYLALISDWYTVLYIVLLKFTFVTGITNTAFSSMGANSSPDLSCNLWDHCWSLRNQQCCSLIAGGPLESSSQSSPWNSQEGQEPPPNASFSVDLGPY